MQPWCPAVIGTKTRHLAMYLYQTPDGRMVGRADVRTDNRMKGRTDGRTYDRTDGPTVGRTDDVGIE